jgi:glutaredoxin
MVKVYGAGWCGATQRTLSRFDRLGVPCDHINVEQDSNTTEWVKQHNEGKERRPTVDPVDRALSVPGNAELDAVLCDSV